MSLLSKINNDRRKKQVLDSQKLKNRPKKKNLTLIFYFCSGVMPIIHFYNFFTMETGTVKFFNESKGFGFIVSGGQEIFVHISGLVDKITEGDSVTFDKVQGKKGINAVNVKLA
jgi:CspA family cold shock protein